MQLSNLNVLFSWGPRAFPENATWLPISVLLCTYSFTWMQREVSCALSEVHALPWNFCNVRMPCEPLDSHPQRWQRCWRWPQSSSSWAMCNLESNFKLAGHKHVLSRVTKVSRREGSSAGLRKNLMASVENSSFMIIGLHCSAALTISSLGILHREARSSSWLYLENSFASEAAQTSAALWEKSQ